MHEIFGGASKPKEEFLLEYEQANYDSFKHVFFLAKSYHDVGHVEKALDLIVNSQFERISLKVKFFISNLFTPLFIASRTQFEHTLFC